MNKQITLYGHNGCSFCVKAKKWFEENRIDYINKDVTDEQARKEFEAYNADGIPLFIIKDNDKETEEKIIGFTTAKLVEALSR
ncbi:glutaredoxin family protein [Bacillus arachidis]|uniref:glutaredoxin family protein n=1 Tax=Bacillus arachidis TaxID=2819290 RepID=UPI00255C6F76|nr:glutaredoxin family protein [Bacillus arachidis]WIY58993.1 glutaredoxin family protein [Bacillus arachidis]